MRMCVFLRMFMDYQWLKQPAAHPALCLLLFMLVLSSLVLPVVSVIDSEWTAKADTCNGSHGVKQREALGRPARTIK